MAIAEAGEAMAVPEGEATVKAAVAEAARAAMAAGPAPRVTPIHEGGDGRGTGAKGHSNTRGRQDGANAESPNTPGSTKAERGLSFRHRNGIAEEVDSRGRYVMRDNRGRTIVDRTATKSDRDRLRSFLD